MRYVKADPKDMAGQLLQSDIISFDIFEKICLFKKIIDIFLKMCYSVDNR